MGMGGNSRSKRSFARDKTSAEARRRTNNRPHHSPTAAGRGGTMPELNHVIDFSTYDANNEEKIHTTVDNIRIQRVTLKDFDQELYAELEETFDRVVRERNMDDDDEKKKKKCDNDVGEAHCPSFLKLPPPSEWKVYTLVDYPGFFFISQQFTPRQQLFWIQQCLETYSQPPNLTNHYPLVG